MPKCIDCNEFAPSGANIGFCRKDSVPGTINPMAETQCKNHPERKKHQLSDKMFNNKLGTIKG